MNSIFDNIHIRHSAEGDVAFIHSSWLRSYRRSPITEPLENGVFFPYHGRIIGRLLRGGVTLVAAHNQYKDEIIGWICGYRLDKILILHYVYVKSAYRKLGVARGLFKALCPEEPSEVIATHITYANGIFAKKLKLINNPYLLEEWS